MCPPGANCGNSTFVSIVCCGVPLRAAFPPSASLSQRQKIIAKLLSDCRLKQEFCGGNRTPPTTPEQIFFSREMTAASECPASGQESVGIYTFVLPAGSFLGHSQNEADRAAKAFAGAQIGQKFCVAVPGLCPCKGEVMNFALRISGGRAPFVASVTAGNLPAGTTLSVAGSVVSIKGTAAASGISSFTLRITDSSGGRWQQNLKIRVLEIATTSLPPFVVGVPYSYQLLGTGGSGNYAFKLIGNLPTGIEMTLAGLIHGTATVAVASSFSVQMIDLACQAVDRTFFRPAVQLTGNSHTVIATVRGYDEFTSASDPVISPSVPPKRYFRRVYTPLLSGDDSRDLPVETNEAQSATLSWVNLISPSETVTPISSEYVLMSGQDRINVKGVEVETANLELWSSCSDPANLRPLYDNYIIHGLTYPLGLANGDTAVPPPDPSDPRFSEWIKCDTYIDDPLNLITDNSNPVVFRGGAPVTSNTLKTITVDDSADFNAYPLVWFPFFMIAGPSPHPGGGTWSSTPGTGFSPNVLIRIKYKHSYEIRLLDEYTDLIALNNAQIINSNGLTAENLPRTTGYVTRTTSVQYHLNLRNLVFGEFYVATVDLVDSVGSVATRTYNFTATATTHVINDTIPTPAAGRSITAQNARVTFTT